MDYHDLEKMTVIQLREEAKKIPGVKGVTGMKKDELLSMLVDHHGLEVPEKKAPKKSGGAPARTKGEMKEFIARLKSEREAARAAGDLKQASLLRRRIHTLKRRLRKLA